MEIIDLNTHPLLSLLPQTSNKKILSFSCFNDEKFNHKIKASHRLNEQDLGFFQGNSPLDLIARLVCQSKSLRLKELLESMEFYLKIRKHIKVKQVKDLCCGHGLVGLIIACLEKEIEEVELVDIQFSQAHHRLYEILQEAFPHISTKIKRRTCRLSDLFKETTTNPAFLIGVHACGQQSDLILDLGKRYKNAVAVMPCCYPPKIKEKYEFLRDVLGVVLTLDIQRTQELQALDYQVQWLEISSRITQMNRIILALP